MCGYWLLCGNKFKRWKVKQPLTSVDTCHNKPVLQSCSIFQVEHKEVSTYADYSYLG